MAVVQGLYGGKRVISPKEGNNKGNVISRNQRRKNMATERVEVLGTGRSAHWRKRDNRKLWNRALSLIIDESFLGDLWLADGCVI